MGDILLTSQEPSSNYMRCNGSLFNPKELSSFSQVYRNATPFYDIYEEVGTLDALSGLSAGNVKWAKEIKINNITYMCVGIYNNSTYKGQVLLFDGNSWYIIWSGTKNYECPIDACVYKGVFIFAVEYQYSSATGAFKIIGYDNTLGNITDSSSYVEFYASSNTYYLSEESTKRFVESDSHINILVTSKSGTSSSATKYFKIAYSADGKTWNLTGNISAVSADSTYSGSCALAYDKISKKFYLFHSKYYTTGGASICVEQNTSQTSTFTVLIQSSFDHGSTNYEGIHYFKSYNNVFYFSTGDRTRRMLKCTLSNLTNTSTYSSGYTEIGSYRGFEKIEGDYIYTYTSTEIKRLNITNGELIKEVFYMPWSKSETFDINQYYFIEICNINGYSYFLDGSSWGVSNMKLYRGSKKYGPVLESPL